MSNNIIFYGNGTDWCKQSLAYLKNTKGITVFSDIYPCKKGLRYQFCRLVFSSRFSRIIPKFLKKAAYGIFLKELKHKKKDTFILVVYDRNVIANDIAFLNKLKKHYSNIKLIYLFTNIVKLTGASKNSFVSKLKDYYDIVYAFDKNDAENLHFKYSPLIYTESISESNAEETDVYYVGRAKDRLAALYNVYSKLESMGLKKKFYIFNVSEEEKLKGKDDIVYNSLIPYNQALSYIKKTKCILDVIQGDSEGYTIKVCEAIYYNKLLITTNKKIKEAPFYNKDFILIIENADDIEEEFFANYSRVSYTEQDRYFFSGERFINQVKTDLRIGE